jgi:hypothetical protein
VQFLADNTKQNEAIALCTDLSQSNPNIQDAEEVLRTLRTGGLGLPSSNTAAIEAFREACHLRFPYAVVFFPPGTYTCPQPTPPWAPDVSNIGATKECFDHDNMDHDDVQSGTVSLEGASNGSHHVVPNGDISFEDEATGGGAGSFAQVTDSLSVQKQKTLCGELTEADIHVNILSEIIES